MSSKINTELGRRGFLKSVVSVTGAVPLSARLPVAAGVAGTTAVSQSRAEEATASATGVCSSNASLPEAGYQSLGPDEASFVEAMVNIMCPADGLTPSGVDLGLATYIDRQLAGGFGKGERLYMYGPWKLHAISGFRDPPRIETTEHSYVTRLSRNPPKPDATRNASRGPAKSSKETPS
jgi:hypothetical protein